MGTSTVSGPFRSANGFQQLDENGVWVPVTGGGGGGSNTALIVPRPAGSQLNFTLPAPTAVGQIYTLELAPYSGSATSDFLYIRVPDFGSGTQTFASGFPVFNVYGGTPVLLSLPTYGNSGPSEAIEICGPSLAASEVIGMAITIVYCGIDANNLGNFRVSGQLIYSVAP